MKKILGVILSVILIMSSQVFAFASEETTTYHCDYKVVSFNTNVEITKEGDKIGNISGKIIRLITDPLTFTDTDDNIIGQASDTYAFIAQDSHGIIIGDKLEVVMAGKFKIFGEKYELLDANGEKIGEAVFNTFRTSGTIKDADGNLCAKYSSPLFFYDYDVEIYNDTFSDESILLMMASYMSDAVTDSRTSSSSSNKNN